MEKFFEWEYRFMMFLQNSSRGPLQNKGFALVKKIKKVHYSAENLCKNANHDFTSLLNYLFVKRIFGANFRNAVCDIILFVFKIGNGKINKLCNFFKIGFVKSPGCCRGSADTHA